MHSQVLLAALGGLAAAAPNALPQDINFDLVYALPNPSYSTETGVTAQTVAYDPTAVLDAAVAQITSSVQPSDSTATPAVQKRTACQPQPAGATGAPAVSDSPSAFLASADFASVANGAPIPSGYTQTFKNLQASNNAYGYMGYTSLQAYDVQTCANKCNAINGCMAFNIFFERDPSAEPGTGCTNPSSVTMIKCVWWGGPVNQGNANNNGQFRSSFQVVIAGSNGYQNKAITTPTGYTTPVYLGNAAINAPLDSYGFDTFMGSAVFNSGPFDISLCSDACNIKSQYNLAHPPTDGSPVTTCKFFNTYILYINSTSNPAGNQGQYCAMYSESWPSNYATNVGQYRGNDHFLIEFSYSSSSAQDAGAACKDCAVHQASKDIAYSTLQPFCSSLLSYTVPRATQTVTATLTPTSTTVVSVVAVETDYVKRDAVPVDKRALSTPAALTRYPSAVISSACSLQATAVTTTSTSTTTATITAAAIVVTSTTTYSTSSTTSTTSVPVATPNASCAGAVCGKFISCNAEQPCSCYTSSDGQGYCAMDSYCNQIPSCKTNADCATGSICAVNTCCGAAGVCLSTTTCANDNAPKRLFRFGKRASDGTSRNDGSNNVGASR